MSQADINASLQEQVALLTEQKALADQQVQARTAEVKKLSAKVCWIGLLANLLFAPCFKVGASC